MLAQQQPHSPVMLPADLEKLLRVLQGEMSDVEALAQLWGQSSFRQFDTLTNRWQAFFRVATRSEAVLVCQVLQILMETRDAASQEIHHVHPPEPSPTLTERELQVLEGIGRGQSNTDIGQELSIHPHTVKNIVRGLNRKLGTTDRADALTKARELGLIQ